ncbi:GntR family transcriptional regulator [Agromyces salentinus]|uniref:GntR family transcriptional regulator n=1 Tax=Agromyces salentinus TaxID=269421 RepID=A0ABP4YWH8_9MICO|nr:GntR family transcriptional regulator [Agromyces salentinus]
MDESRPIFIQITEQVENDIIEGTLAEGSQIPSTNEFAAFLRINPATALRGVNRLVDDGIVEKRRGIGMFVTAGARERLVERRRAEFSAQYIRPLIVEAEKLGLDIDELAALIRSERIES